MTFNANSVRTNTKGTFVRDYRGEIDYFLVFCEETGDVYAIRMDDTLRRAGRLRVAPPANNQRRRIRWAVDHALPRAEPRARAA